MSGKDGEQSGHKIEVERLRRSVLEWISTQHPPVMGKKRQKIAYHELHLAGGDEPAVDFSPHRSGIFAAIIRIVFVAVFLLILFGVLLYTGIVGDVAAQTATKLVPYPAAIVNFRPIKLYDYLREVGVLKYYYANNTPVGTPLPSLADIQTHVYNRLVEQELVRQLANRYGVFVTEEELLAQSQKLADAAGGEQAFNSELNQLYGWGAVDFNQSLLEPLLLKNKVMLAAVLDDRVNQDARERAKKVLAQVQAQPKDFADLARLHSEDVTASGGGDLGYVAPGDLTPQLEAAAFSLPIGEVSGLIYSPFGYHIVVVEERLVDESSDVVRARVRQILIQAKPFDEVLESFKKEAVIWQLVKI